MHFIGPAERCNIIANVDVFIEHGVSDSWADVEHRYSQNNALADLLSSFILQLTHISCY